ncbi:hypothetical protein DUNSADRAFT_11756 [Dunaliella salina]|uniref:Protein TIC 20 n=1 Tax=Dunaliella salina TaxID=3046 RepID=A0ABQ7GCP3_DUNSA|nr:hypothetical protein DUNSADRAFT_11756 [Dunaliella salina]|eukprot:KAF5832385.1 hypothetical protein DUNSADRAFT_11756 [Dunaliella salina]
MSSMLGLRAKSQYTASTSKTSVCSSSQTLLGAGRCQLRGRMGMSLPSVEPVCLPILNPSVSRASTSRRGDLQQCCSGGRAGIDPGDRVIASLPYLLPLLDSIPFGKFILLQYPFVARALAPLAPLAALYNSFPFAPFVIFLGVYSGIVANQNLPRFVRYNAMQAVLLDILLMCVSFRGQRR